MSANYIIKSKISERQFEERVYKWLTEGDYTPDDITDNIITENNKVLFPLYFYTHNYSGTCNAVIGFRREVPYNYYDTHKQKHVQGSNWVTDWHPHNQRVSGTIKTSVSAAQSSAYAGFAEGTGWQADELIEMNRDFPYREELMKLYQLSEDDCWENRGKKKAYDQVVKQIQLPSPLVNSFSLDDLKYTRTNCFGVLVPFWKFTYTYQGQDYFVFVDGNNPERINGTRPEDKDRKDTVENLQWLGWLAGLSAIVSTLYFMAGSFNDIELNWTTIGIVAGGLFSTWAIVKLAVNTVKDRSKKIRTESLNRLFKRDALATQ